MLCIHAAGNLYGTTAGNYGDDGHIFALKPSPIPAPSLILKKVTTLDSRSVTVDYTISKTAVTKPLRFDIYRSDKATLDTTSKLIGTETISPAADAKDLTEGSHTVKLIPGTILPSNKKMEFIIVMADHNNAIQLAPGSSSTAYFQKIGLAAVAHGLSTDGKMPAWEATVAADLKKYDGFTSNEVIQFNWASSSNLPLSGEATAAGDRLYGSIVGVANTLASAHAGDVVDLHLIGHSRGTVVVNRALQDLLGTSNAALEGSYIIETLLDPHPANVATLDLYSGSSASLVTLYKGFEKLANDPAIVIPPNVSMSEVYYQHTPYSLFEIRNIGSR
jgi:hypothetical protein